MWEFFAKFTTHGYNKTPINFLFDLLKLKLPELLKTDGSSSFEPQLERHLRGFIKQDERIPKRLLTAVEHLLVRICKDALAYKSIYIICKNKTEFILLQITYAIILLQ